MVVVEKDPKIYYQRVWREESINARVCPGLSLFFSWMARQLIVRTEQTYWPNRGKLADSFIV